jgi:hypothetical protein
MQAMSSWFRAIFLRPDYQSEVTEFIGQLKSHKPELEAQQRAGRALLWDKPIDLLAARDTAQARVPQKPYVYQTNV